MPRFKSNNFYQDRTKIKLFLQKTCKKFLAASSSSPKSLCLLCPPPLDPQLQVPGSRLSPEILFYFHRKNSGAATIFSDCL